jgi:hypothetical protein
LRGGEGRVRRGTSRQEGFEMTSGQEMVLNPMKIGTLFGARDENLIIQ